MPSQKELLTWFNYDPDTGLLTYKVKRGKMLPGKEAGYINGLGYRVVSLGNRKYDTVHRVIWTMVHGKIPDGQCIDHQNGNKTDNRLVNLRLVSRAENQRNMKLRTDNTSGCPGVWWCSYYKKWFAAVFMNRRKIGLGSFNDRDEAIRTRKKAERTYNYHKNHGRIVQ